jgi:hypothetical protein
MGWEQRSQSYRKLWVRVKTTAASFKDAERKDTPVPEIKVVLLDERAKDEQKLFPELQPGAKKLLQGAIETSSWLSTLSAC